MASGGTPVSDIAESGGVSLHRPAIAGPATRSPATPLWRRPGSAPRREEGVVLGRQWSGDWADSR
jgi:hypothetical protein